MTKYILITSMDLEDNEQVRDCVKITRSWNQQEEWLIPLESSLGTWLAIAGLGQVIDLDSAGS